MKTIFVFIENPVAKQMGERIQVPAYTYSPESLKGTLGYDQLVRETLLYKSEALNYSLLRQGVPPYIFLPLSP